MRCDLLKRPTRLRLCGHPFLTLPSCWEGVRLCLKKLREIRDPAPPLVGRLAGSLIHSLGDGPIDFYYLEHSLKLVEKYSNQLLHALWRRLLAR